MENNLTDQKFLVNADVVARFKRLIDKKHLAHAYLFAGAAGTGKFQTALAIAKMANCLDFSPSGDGACNRCSNCLKMNAGAHPDAHIYESSFIEPIKIEQMRELLSQIKLRPFEGTKKVFIIKNVENLTLEAGNALLKTLEEPTINSLLLLTTTSVDKCLDTVVSRCHRVLFYPLSVATLTSRIGKYYDDLVPGQAHFLAALSQGSLGKARELKESDIFKKRDEIVQYFILEKNSDDYIKKILADKNDTKEFLDVLLSWIRDSLLLKNGFKRDSLIHQEYAPSLENFSRQYTYPELEELYKQTVNMFKMLAENLNVRVPLLVIKELLHG